ncbi:MAG: 50S ribosomal protein L11 methyltransferase [Prevotella sp.]|nr:50S ribosomal protein L11 methyltransferase [Prevotella sp.]MCM1074955.1 50S ribosomal protein L11 methyltransferase [Ruminococcus sp.]
MTDYQELRIDIKDCNETVTDLLAAYLADVGYESFVPDNEGLTAYISADAFSLDDVENILAEFPMEIEATVSEELVKGKDWNSEWEKNYFKPIIVGGECVVHSSFHKDVPQAKYDIVIDPKMAFGTGHHATTSLIIEYLLEMCPAGKSVIDMGTGTGILAILCHKLGAKSVTGIEIDEGAWQNAVENAALNDAAEVYMIHGDARALTQFALMDTTPDRHADLLLANINRNIILADMKEYAAALKPGGIMILSGFYTEDVPLLSEAAAMHGLSVADSKSRDNWCALRLTKA